MANNKNRLIIDANIDYIRKRHNEGIEDISICKKLGMSKPLFVYYKRRVPELWEIYNPCVPFPVRKGKKQLEKEAREKEIEEESKDIQEYEDDSGLSTGTFNPNNQDKFLIEMLKWVVKQLPYKEKKRQQYVVDITNGKKNLVGEIIEYIPLDNNIISFILTNMRPEYWKKADREETLKQLQVVLAKEVKDVYSG